MNLNNKGTSVVEPSYTINFLSVVVVNVRL
jgi:hypothetical protein